MLCKSVKRGDRVLLHASLPTRGLDKWRMSIRSVGIPTGNETHVFPDKDVGLSAITTYIANILYGNIFINILQWSCDVVLALRDGLRQLQVNFTGSNHVLIIFSLKFVLRNSFMTWVLWWYIRIIESLSWNRERVYGSAIGPIPNSK